MRREETMRVLWDMLPVLLEEEEALLQSLLERAESNERQQRQGSGSCKVIVIEGLDGESERVFLFALFAELTVPRDRENVPCRGPCESSSWKSCP